MRDTPTTLLGAGCMVFHRSGDTSIGLHGNSGLWRPGGTAHRVALVLYQTDLKLAAKADPLLIL